jgi:hypothetical protein
MYVWYGEDLGICLYSRLRIIVIVLIDIYQLGQIGLEPRRIEQ